MALTAVKYTAAAFDAIRPPDPGLVLLIYHRLGRHSNSRVDLPVWLFEEQMARLNAEPGVIDLNLALCQLRDACEPDRGSVVVTFDDGTADFVDLALPILVGYGIPVTLYVATDFVDSGRPFPQSGRPASWAALSDALTTGLVTIGSHTHEHLLLDRVDVKTAAYDLERSVGLIEDRLGIPALHFAYPKALLGTPDVEQEVRSRFRSAAVAGTRPNPYGNTDPHRLARSPVQLEDGLRFFDLKARGGMRLEDDLRRRINIRRFAGRKF